ncbi:MAG: alkaline phosphatase family protein [Saprospiraceae bacterium]|nr:alkaline phosphatase family protein [Saprospiraceae bacterium]
MLLKNILITSLSIFACTAFTQDSKKVLIIGIDGCRSDVLQYANTPNIDDLTAQSIHSYSGLNNDITYSGPGWSAMMTGVWSDKHGVTDNSFSGSNFDEYPHFIKRVEDFNSDLYTVSISQWHPINNFIVLDHADYKYNAPTEADVTAEALEQLENENPDVMFLQYDEVDHAGHGYGFSQDITEYVASIESVDTQIGFVLNGLYARENYNSENWLIILSTDHGGLGTSHGGNSLQEEIIFYIASNKNISQYEITADTIEIIDETDCIENNKHLTFDDGDDMVDIPHFSELDFGADQDFTIECRVKTSIAEDVSIIGNKDWDNGVNDGFVFSFKFANGPEWKINIGDGSNRIDINDGGAIADNKWHHLAASFDRDGQAKMYQDGILISSIDMSSIGDIDNSAPLRFGSDIDGEYHYNGALEEVRLWNGLVSESEINDWQCTPLDNTHPSYYSLIGYWPLNETQGSIAYDLSALENDGTITNSNWSSLDSIISYENTPRINDVAITALNWLCIEIEDSWNIEGFNWVDSLAIVEEVIDGAPGSLRSVIDNSCSADSIYFAPALDGQDFLLNKEIEIPHNLNIIGSGISNTSISSNYANRVFYIQLGVNLSLHDMKIHKTQEESNGGAIYNQGDLLLKDVLLIDNYEGPILKALTNEGNIEISNTVKVKN